MTILKMEATAVSRIHCLLLLLTVGSMTAGASRLCHRSHYWHAATRSCRLCTECPKNEIIRKPCGQNTDTECGPFTEFSFFNQLDSSESQITVYGHGPASHENTTVVDQSKDVWKAGKQNEPIVEKDDGEYWKNLAFALIGVVCILIMVATIVVFVACRKLHESIAVKTQEEEDDDDSGYVVMIHRPHPPHCVSAPTAPSTATTAAAALLSPDTAQDNDRSPNPPALPLELHHKGTYTPTRRLLDYDADDVFESEDSSGSRTSRKTAPRPIPAKSISPDTEHVGRGDCG